MYAYIHPDCGKPAFLLTEIPGPRAPHTSKGILHLDRTPMEYGADMVCESCGAPMWAAFLRRKHIQEITEP